MLTRAPKDCKVCPNFGHKTVAVLRAELGDVTRFQRTDQVVAYAGLDLEVKGERQMERTNQALQARQWTASSDLVPGDCAVYPAQRLRLWGLLPPLGCAWYEKA